MKMIHPKQIPISAVQPGVLFRWNDNYYLRAELSDGYQMPPGALAPAVLLSVGRVLALPAGDLVQVYPQAAVVIEGGAG